MIRQIFINSNNNKNTDGFLLMDIIVGLTMFTITGYYFFSVAINAVFLLQTFIKNAIEYSNQVVITRALALGISHDATFMPNNNILSSNYTTELRSINFFMRDDKKVVVDLVIVKSNTVDTVNRVCYMLKNV